MPKTGHWEQSSRTLYDTADIPETSRSGGFQYDFFSKPIGMDKNDRVDTDNGWFTRWLRTNQLIEKKLPAPQEFLAKRLNALFLKDGRPLRIYETSLYGRTTIHFQIYSKTYWLHPAWKCASPFAVFENPSQEIERLGKEGIIWKEIGGVFKTRTSWDNTEVDGLALSWLEQFMVKADISGPVERGIQLQIDLDGLLLCPIQ